MSRTVIDSVENKLVASWYNGKRAIVLAIQRQPGSNTIEVVDEIKQHPAAIHAAAAGIGLAERTLRPQPVDPRTPSPTCR